jgi:signal transduction histidine kinase
LQRIDEQSVKLSTLVSQLLDLSRIEAGRLTLELTLTNITLLVNTVASMMQKNTTRHLINVQTRLEVFAYIDALRLEQVLVNLLDNAIKYSPAGGPINLAVLTSDEQRVLISVTDKGLGIPLERRPYIFERFYQAHLEGYRGGMGLGLYISRQITELHAGTLEVEFPDEGGTRFVIFLPIGASPIDN